jgi:tetratricopeptide (TPR) repeat protein
VTTTRQTLPQRSGPPFVLIALALIGILAGLAWVGIRWYSSRELSRAEAELANSQPAAASRRLRRLAWLSPRDPAVLFLMGACEEAQGRPAAAIDAWSRVPRDSSQRLDATLRRAQLALARGRFAEAESALLELDLPDDHPALASREQMLLQLYLFTIRYDEIGRRKVREWARSHRPEALRVHWLIDETKSFPVAATRDRLEQAGQENPDDDRVWLGKANLATRLGHKDEAASWLERCRVRRPDDPAVRLATLEWAVAFDQISPALEVASSLDASSLSPARVLALRAWLAGGRGRKDAERDALEQLLVIEPGNTQALVRLSELAAGEGQTELVSRLHLRKAEIDRASDEYRMLLTDDPYLKGRPVDEAESADREIRLARCAERLGRWFEARGWWTLVQQRLVDSSEARESLVRLDREQDTRRTAPIFERIARGRHLSDLLADLLESERAGTLRAAAPPGPVVPTFRDEAAGAGLSMIYDNDRTPRCRMPETMGGGVGLIDYDGDGWLDVYVVQGGPFPDPETVRRGALEQRDRLFRNRRDGTFEDVTERSGLGACAGGYGHGVAVGDYDSDGRPDLFVTRWRSYALYRNRGDGTFEDATEKAGLGGVRDWPTSAAFADLDGDGDLDLYVCHYAAWDPATSGPCPHPLQAEKFMYCGPRTFDAMPDHVFRNDGGRFFDVSEHAGINAADREGRGLGVVAADLDGDGKVDIFVANDLTANFLFHNEGGFRFREVGIEAGVATNADGGYLAGMGVACGDLDGDGRPDLAVTNFYGESTTFYRNLGGGQFADHSSAVGLTAASRYLLGFGAVFLDANNDGWLDLATANGHVNDLRPHVPYAMPAQLLLGEGSGTGRLRDVSSQAGEPWSVPRLGRGLAAGDLDNDGRLDLLLVSEGAPLAYLHHQGPATRFLTLRLEGTKSNRDGVGASVSVVAGGHRQVAQRFGGGSFLSASDQRLHFGMGAETRAQSVEVRWPSGQVDVHHDLASDTAWLLREGERRVQPLAGWRTN